MWYVVWTSTGSEERVAKAVKEMSCQNRCFVPKRIVQVKRKGEWQYTEKDMFPGYFFVDTDDIEFLSWENGILSVRGAGSRVWQFSAADLRAELEHL